MISSFFFNSRKRWAGAGVNSGRS